MKRGDSFFDFAWNFAIHLMVLLVFQESLRKFSKIGKNRYLSHISHQKWRSKITISYEKSIFSKKWGKLLKLLNSLTFCLQIELSLTILACSFRCLQSKTSNWPVQVKSDPKKRWNLKIIIESMKQKWCLNKANYTFPCQSNPIMFYHH